MVSLSNPFNLGARHLNAILKGNGYDSHMVFLGDIIVNDLIRPTPDEIDAAVNLIINEIKPDIIGISVSCSAFYKDAVTLTTKLRERNPKLIIMWGGIHVFLRPQDCIDYADLCFTGEAEIQLVEAMKAIEETGKIPTNLDGTWARVDGQVYKNPYGRIVEDLDTIPYPDYDNERKYVIRSDQVLHHEPFYPQVYSLFVISSRGCPFNCTFCASAKFSKEYQSGDRPGRYIRQRSVGNVIGEIQYICDSLPIFRAAKDATVNFGDDVFVLNETWVGEFCRQYRERFDKPFWCYFHPNTVKENIVLMLKDVGMTYVDMGVQSASERVRTQLYKRSDTDEKIHRAFDILRKNNIGITIDIITDNPFDTDDDRRKGLEFLLSLPRPFLVNYLSLILFPEVEFTRMVLDAGLKNEEDIEQHRLKIFEQWQTKFDWPKRPKDELFWIALYHMTGKIFVPRWWIRFLSRIKYFERKPGFVVWNATFAAKFAWFLKRLRIFFRRLFRGQIRMRDILYSVRKYRKLGVPME